MRAIVLALLAVTSAARVSAAFRAQEQPTGTRQMVGRFGSPILTVRMGAVHEALEVVKSGRGQELLRSPEIQAGLLELLRRENGMHVRRFFDQDAAKALGDGEGWAEYYSEAGELAMGMIPLLDVTRQRDWLKLLARGSYNVESRFGVWLAEHGDLVIDALLDQTKTAAIAPDRWNAYGVLAQMVAFTAFTPQGSHPLKHPLSFGNRQRALNAVNEGLNHPDTITAKEVVRALRSSPSAETHGILQDFLRKARGRPGFSTRGEGPRSLQEEVEKAIADTEVALHQKRR